MIVLKYPCIKCWHSLRQGGWLALLVFFTLYQFIQHFNHPQYVPDGHRHRPVCPATSGRCDAEQPDGVGPPYRLNAFGQPCDSATLLKRHKVNLTTTALLSAPGSGNTWMRWLIQGLTGVCTGSIYHDKDLKKNGFPCEGMQKGVIAVKTHILDEFPADKIILVVRNPYDAVVADFNRAYSGSNHTGVAEWTELTASYFHDSVRRFGYTWLESVVAPLRSAQQLLVVFYEDLKKDTRSQLRRIADFLLVNVDEARIECVMRRGKGTARRQPARSTSTQDVFRPSERAVIDALISAARIALNEYGVVDMPDYYSYVQPQLKN